MKFEKDFKEALSQLPPEEKDKLILRLLKHDPVLVERLQFELLGTQSVEDLRREMEKLIKDGVVEIFKQYYSPGYLFMNMRHMSGYITHHVKTTGDKVCEPALNMLMLIEMLKTAGTKIVEAGPAKSHNFCIYVIARTFRILVQIDSLDDDLFIDFEDDLRELGELIAADPLLAKVATDNGLNIHWLIRGKIPEDIALIHKDIRSRGLLKSQ
jgi:DNA-binding Lrp family transcriptional regulator